MGVFLTDLNHNESLSASPKAKPIRRRWLFFAAATLSALALVFLALWLLFPRAGQALEVYWDLPDFAFTDQVGQTVTRQDLQGRVVVANFIFTNCAEFCPTLLTPRMQELQTRLKSEGLLGRQVVLLSFSVDPETDTPDTLRAYAQRYGAESESWRLLTGPPEVMRSVIVDGLKLGYYQVPQSIQHTHEDGAVHTHGYNIAHTNRFILVDRQGRVRAFFDGVVDWDIDKVLRDVQRLSD